MRNQQDLHAFYVEHLTRQLLPFWKKAVDAELGGVFTGFDPLGQKLLHQDKFTWSQGRFLWLWSRLAGMCRSELIDDDRDVFLKQAELTYQFIKRHAFLPDGSCMFLLTKDGQPKEMIPGAGHDISIYADCFVVMGMAEYARAAGDQDALQTAQKLYAHIESRFQAGKVRSEPYPIPEGYDAHGFAMIMLNTSQALAKAAEDMTGQERSLYRNQAWFYAGRILSGFCDSEHRIREVVPKSKAGEHSAGTLLLRHLNPGHTVESLWFVMEEAALRQDHDALQLAVKALKRALRMGWDEAFGGLLRYVDVDGGPPKGDDISGGERFEKLIRESWDTKLWWPHSEGLYACRLAFELTGDADCLAWYEKLHEYTFNTFPAAPGEEWLQIRDRRGEPIAQVVALPVKDPYHVMRNVMLMIELTAAE